MEQVPELDAILVPISGGGMISGIAIAAKSVKNDVKGMSYDISLCSFSYVKPCSFLNVTSTSIKKFLRENIKDRLKNGKQTNQYNILLDT